MNPISGTQKSRDLDGLLKEHLDEGQFDWELYHTTERGDATRRAQKAVIEGMDAVIAIGGDGTINEVAQALVHTSVALGIVPKGSGNGLAYHLGIFKDLNKAIDQLNESQEQWIDTARFNGQLFLNVAGIGFDAHIAHAFDSHGTRGFFSYLALTLREFMKFDSQRFELVLDGKVINRSAFMLSVANGSQFGNHAFIAPDADISDGYLDLVIVKQLRGWEMLSFPFRLFNRSLRNSRSIEVKKVRKIEVVTTMTKGHLDGEPVVLQEENLIEIVPESLKVLVPKR